MTRVWIALWLAWRDWLGEWRMSCCLVIGVAAATAPLLMLFSVRAGVIEGMREELQRFPSSRELRTVGQPVIRWPLVQGLRGRDDVAFVSPTIRLLSASGVVRPESGAVGAGEAVDLAPSGPGDPLAAIALSGSRWAPRSIVVSDAVARPLALNKGARVALWIDRTGPDGRAQADHVVLTLAGVLPAWTGERRLALIDAGLLAATETYREDPAAEDLTQALATARQASVRRTYAGLRLYAKDIGAVEALRDVLLRQGVTTESRLGEIRLIQSLDRALTTLFVLIASFASAGLCLSLAAAQWAWVDRRRRDLSYLRLVGLEAGHLSIIPAAHGMLTTVVGVAVAGVVAWGGAMLINDLFAGRLSGVTTVSRLRPEHIALAAGVAIIAGLLASAAASIAARRVSPATVLREG